MSVSGMIEMLWHVVKIFPAIVWQERIVFRFVFSVLLQDMFQQASEMPQNSVYF